MSRGTMSRWLPSPILTFPLFLFSVLAIATSVTSLPSLPLPVRVVHQFPNQTWVENLAVRSNGEILVTRTRVPELYLINTLNGSATLIYKFPFGQNLAGITEVEHDVFYVPLGNYSAAKSFSLWEVDMRHFPRKQARVRKVTDLTNTTGPNGAVTLSKADHTILIADCVLGAVWRLNVKTGAYAIAISDPTMAPVLTARVVFGINGLKISHGYLYFTSTNQGLMCRVPISKLGTATGAVEVLATGIQPDDFDLDGRDRPWIAQNVGNVVSVLLANGTVVDVAGAKDQLTVAGATSCAFGLAREKDLLYCTTTGGLAAPVNGTLIVGGSLVVIDTKGF